MRRSGITSRSKCAIFSISQMSCSSAGPRGPAVMMLVLSATGEAGALGDTLSFGLIGFPVVSLRAPRSRAGRPGRRLKLLRCFDCRRSWGLPAPGGSSDDVAKIDAGEMRILVRQHVGVDVAEGRLRLVLVAVVEGLDDVFLEMRAARMRAHHRLALRVAVARIVDPEHVHFDAGHNQADDR